MSDIKYVLTEDAISHEGSVLYRITVMKDFSDVKAGDLGGCIESEENLSQEGDCWVYDDAKVFYDAKVYDEAEVSGLAMVFNEVHVYGESQVYERARVYGEVEICNRTQVFGDAQVYGGAST